MGYRSRAQHLVDCAGPLLVCSWVIVVGIWSEQLIRLRIKVARRGWRRSGHRALTGNVAQRGPRGCLPSAAPQVELHASFHRSKPSVRIFPLHSALLCFSHCVRRQLAVLEVSSEVSWGGTDPRPWHPRECHSIVAHTCPSEAYTTAPLVTIARCTHTASHLYAARRMRVSDGSLILPSSRTKQGPAGSLIRPCVPEEPLG